MSDDDDDDEVTQDLNINSEENFSNDRLILNQSKRIYQSEVTLKLDNPVE